MSHLLFLLGVLAQIFLLRVHIRFTDGRPAPAVTARALQGKVSVGECVTDATGWCDLALTLDPNGDQPLLALARFDGRGYTFAPVYGVEGTDTLFILWPEILNAGVVGFVLDAPDGVRQDSDALATPTSAMPTTTLAPSATHVQVGISAPPTSVPTLLPTPIPSSTATPMASAFGGQAAPSASGGGWSNVFWLVGIGALLLLLTGFARRLRWGKQ